MDEFIYAVIVFGSVVTFCAVLLAFLVLLSAAFFNDPEFDYVDDLKYTEQDMPTPLLGVVAPKEKRDTDA